MANIDIDEVITQMVAHDPFGTRFIRRPNENGSLKAPWTQDSRIDVLKAVRGADDNDAIAAFHGAVEQGVEVEDDRLPIVGVARPFEGVDVRHRVDLVEKEDRRRLRHGLIEGRSLGLDDLVEVAAGRCEPLRHAGHHDGNTQVSAKHAR